jgi:hypothetical protein
VSVQRVAGTPSAPAGATPPGDAFVLRVRGDAMGSWLRPGDRLRLERRAPRRGDVALVAVAGRVVLQRLVRRRGAGWLVRGDARAALAYVGDEQVVAVATARARAQGASGWTRIDGVWGRAGALAFAPARRVAWALRRRRPRALR